MSEAFKASMVFVAVFLFFTGFMLTDYGASLRASGAGGHGESLILAEMPPRIMYHAGLLTQLSAFFLLYAISVSYVTRLSSGTSSTPVYGPHSHSRFDRSR